MLDLRLSFHRPIATNHVNRDCYHMPLVVILSSSSYLFFWYQIFLAIDANQCAKDSLDDKLTRRNQIGIERILGMKKRAPMLD